MGWSFGYGDTKQDVIRQWTEEQGWGEGKVVLAIRHCVRGNVLYTVHEIREKETGKAVTRFIAVILLGTDGHGNWGYKDMTESMGPCYHSCPLAYLDMVPCPGGYATEWREAVRAYWAGKKTPKLVDGMKMRMVKGGWKMHGTPLLGMGLSLKKEGRRWVVRLDNGVTCRFPRRMLNDAEPCASL